MKSSKIVKRFVMIIMVCVLVMSSIAASAAVTYKKSGKTRRYTGASYKVYYNGVRVNTASRPALKINNNIMIPYNYTLVARGPRISYSYNKKKKMLTLCNKKNLVKLYLNKKYMYVNGKKKSLSTAPFTAKLNGPSCIMVPAKAVVPALGFKYKYDKNTKSVFITGDQAAATTAPAATTTTAAKTTTTTTTTTTSDLSKASMISATKFKGMTTSQFIAAIGPIAQENYRKTGVLASITMAQCILESGWGKSYLAQNANNMFGMKTSLSGNTWKGSTWDQKSYLQIKTGEEYGGKKVTITAKFRKYKYVGLSVDDHSAYLLNAMNGSAKRYAGLASTASFEKQANIIKKGGYATSSNYVASLKTLAKTYNLTKYDKK
ncbi:MAG: glucosaminidase domain-containing protein [Eubacterium sp.]|nr:glucosaminidase domain-containing protein [Eubacterium sp.]